MELAAPQRATSHRREGTIRGNGEASGGDYGYGAPRGSSQLEAREN